MTDQAPLSFPVSPYSFQRPNGGPLGLLPVSEQGLDSVYALLLTDEDFLPSPAYLGALRSDDRLSALHLLFSVGISHLSLPLAADGCEHQARAQLVVRRYVHPSKPRRFAFLLMMVVHGLPSRCRESEPNLHRVDYIKAPTAGAAPGGFAKPAAMKWKVQKSMATGAGDEEDEDEPELDTASAPAGVATAVKQPPSRIRPLLGIFNVARHVGTLFTPSLADRFAQCSNLHLLTPHGHGIVDSSFLNLFALPRRLTEQSYLETLIASVQVCEVSSDQELTYLAAGRPLDDVQRANVRRYEAHPLLAFTDKEPLSLLRTALSLPNALCALEGFFRALGVDPGDWANAGHYVGVDPVSNATVHASPYGVPTYVMPLRESTTRLDNVLYVTLPITMTAHTLLSDPAVQADLVRHKDPHIVHAVLDGATHFGFTGWFSGTRQWMERTRAGKGALSARSFRTEDEFCAFVLRHVHPQRVVASEVGLLRKQVEEVRVLLLDQSRPVAAHELLALDKMALDMLLRLARSGADANAVMLITANYFSAGLLPNGQQVNVMRELFNFRECFADSLTRFSDLTDTSAMLAKMGIAVRGISGVMERWSQVLLNVMVATAGFLDGSQRVHIETTGNASTGKTVVVNTAMECFLEAIVETFVFSTSAAARATRPTEGKNKPIFRPESGQEQQMKGGDSRGVDTNTRSYQLSSLDDWASRAKHVEMKETTGGKIREVCTVTQKHSYSDVSATNHDSTDMAFSSRRLIMPLDYLQRQAQTFITAQVTRETMAPALSTTLDSYKRALRFFTTTVAAACMLVNAGVVELPADAVSVAIIAHALPKTSDAQDTRKAKMLGKLSKVLNVWTLVWRLLLSPVSSLALLHEDELSLDSLAMGLRLMGIPLCSPGLFVCSVLPALPDDLVGVRVVEYLLTHPLAPQRAHLRSARRAYEDTLQDLQEIEDATDRAEEERRAHTLFLPRMFPAPGLAEDARLDFVFFRMESLDIRTARPDFVSADSDERGVRHKNNQGRATVHGAFRRPLEPSEHDFVGAEDENTHTHAGDMLDFLSPPLTGAQLEAATNQFVEAMVHGLERTNSQKRKTVEPSHMRDRVRTAVYRLEPKFYQKGWVSVEVRRLQLNDNSRVRNEIRLLLQEYAVPVGGYVQFEVVHPGGRIEAEALRVVRCEADPDVERQPLDALVNTGKGSTIAQHQLARMLDSFGGQAPATVAGLAPHDLTPAAWLEEARQRIVSYMPTVVRKRVLLRAAKVVSDATEGRASAACDLTNVDEAAALVIKAMCLGLAEQPRTQTRVFMQRLRNGLAALRKRAWPATRVENCVAYHEFELRGLRRGPAVAAAGMSSSQRSEEGLKRSPKRRAEVDEAALMAELQE